MKTLLPLFTNLLTKNIRQFSAILLLFVFMCVSGSIQAQIYYATGGSTANTDAGDAIHRSGYDGSSFTTLASAFAPTVVYTAIDFNGNRAFVYENTNKQIKVINLANGTVTNTIQLGSQTVAAMQYDAASGFIYYLTLSLTSGNNLQTDDALRKVKPDGTLDQLVVSSIVNTPRCLALDLAHNQVFVVDAYATSVSLKRIVLGGSPTTATATTIFTQTKTIVDIAYNPIDQYVYILQIDGSYKTSTADDAIKKVKNDAGAGTTPTLVAASIGYAPTAFSLDPGNDRAFFYEGGQQTDSPVKAIMKSVKLSDGTISGTILNLASRTDIASMNSIIVPQVAAVTSANVASIAATSATLGGNISHSDVNVSERGIVYSSSNQTPTVGGASVTKAANGTGVGAFSASISGLNAVTTYYARAYATSGAGTAYGDVVTFSTTSNDATLSGLLLSAGTLNPNFSSSAISYTASVPSTVPSITVTPTRNQANATITVNGTGVASGSASGAIGLNIGTNTITTVVTAQDGTTTKTYTVTITKAKADQTITFASINTKTYGDADYAAGATASSGLGVSFSSDNTNVATVISGQVHIVGAGTANITASQGGDANNNAATNVVQTLTVNKASQTITFNTIPAKTYGTPDFAPGATVSSGLTVSYSSDNTAVATIVSNQIHIVGQGTANITASQAGNGNYNAAANVAQLLTVNKATITVTAVAKTKIYGADDPAFTYTVTGVVGSDAPTGALSRVTPNTNIFVGTYAIDLGTLSYGANYNINYTGANLTINKRQITILPAAKTKIYGDDDPFLNQYQFISGSLAPQDGSTDQYGRAAGESVGSYLMTLGNKKFINIATSTDVTANYDITIQPAYFTITVKPIAVNVYSQTKAYGNADPTLTYTSAPLAFSDTFTGALTRTAGENVGTYAINQGTLALGSNYNMIYVGANLSIGAKTINVTANAKTKTYGTADPAFDYTNDALAVGDSFTGTLTRDAGEGAGTHTITQGSLALSSNYTLNYTGANLSIGKANLTYVATPASRPSQTANPTFAGSVTGFVNGDNQASATTGTLSFTSTAGLSSPLGTYPIVGSGLSAANYDFVQSAANSTALTITASEDATLANLTVDQGVLNPVFNSEQTSYGFGVANDVASFNLTATVNQPNATMNFNGSTITSGVATNVPLNTGPNNFNIIVTAQDGSTTKYYTLNIFRAYDTNNMLASLNLSGLTYSPVFDTNTLNYTASVGNVVTSTDVTATAVSPTTHIFVGGYDLATTNPVTTSLNIGATDVIVVSKAENGDERIYKVTVTRAQSSDATLSSIGNNTITLNTPFVSGTHTYSATVASGIGALTFLPTSTNNAAFIKVNNQNLNTGVGNNVNLSFGPNSIVFDVTSEDGVNHIAYVLNIYRLRSSNADLVSLSFPFITSVNEPFDPNVLQYTADVADSTYTGIPLTAISADQNAIVKIDGTIVPRFSNYTLPVHGGANTYHVVVTSQDTSATKTYTLVLTRAGTPPPLLSPVANLYALNVNATGFSKNFNFTIGEELTTIYAPNNIASVRVFAVSENEVSTVTVNGVTLPYDTTTDLLPISVGDNLFTVVVTSEDGAHTKTYEVHVTRLPFADVTLASLSVNAGTLTPAFVPATRSYTVSVPNTVTSIGVTPVATVGTATIQIGATQISASNPTATVNLFEGPPNRIRVVVTAADGVTSQAYTINVTREAPIVLSDNAAITSLKLTPSSTLIKTSTTKTTTNYSTSVAPDVSSIIITPTAQEEHASILVNGVAVASGTASAPIDLNVGSTIITVTVTGQDGITTRVNLITVDRTGSSNAITSLKLTPSSTLVSTSTAGTTANYSTSVAPDVSSVIITPTAQEEHASILVNGVAVLSGTASAPVNLNAVGPTVITVTTTAQDGISTRTYSITVNRTGSNNAITSLKLTPSSILVSTSTAGTTTNYSTSVAPDVSSIIITPTAQEEHASILVNGVAVASGTASAPIDLNVGSTIITVTVTAQDGISTRTYSTTVNRTGSNNAITSLKLTPSSTLVKTSSAGTTTNYSTSVAPDVSSIIITPTAQEEHASILVNGVAVLSGTASAPVNLNAVGPTVITVTTTAQDGISTRTYSIAVSRTGSNNAVASLKLTPSSILVSTSTVGTTTNYSTSVAPDVSSIIITPTAQEEHASILVNGVAIASGTASAPIDLNVGSTIITVTVTAQDGISTRTYSITVDRTGSNNAITSLKLSPSSTLVKTSSAGTTTNYSTTVNPGTNSIIIMPTAQNVYAVIKVNGETVVSGTAASPIDLNVGSTEINIVVTAQDGVSVRTYTITVNKPSTLLMVDKNDSKLLFANKPANNLAPTDDDGVVVHQGISPNGDGSNDFLYIEGISAYPGNKLSIMNTSGTLVFDTKDYGKDGSHLFDGHNKSGVLLKPGTYFYALEYQVNKQSKRKTGYIIIKY
jgi:hypothetical protein